MFTNKQSLTVLKHNNHPEVYPLIGKNGLLLTLDDLKNPKILCKFVRVFIKSDYMFFASVHENMDSGEWLVDLMKSPKGELRITTREYHIVIIDLKTPIAVDVISLLRPSVLEVLQAFQTSYSQNVG